MIFYKYSLNKAKNNLLIFQKLKTNPYFCSKNMWLFKKSIPPLKSLIPSGSTDIHSHILPGIDDGAADLQTSSTLIQGLIDLGFSKSIATPHTMAGVYDNTNASINQALQTTVAQLEDNKTNFPLKAASEYMMDNMFFNRIKNGESLLTLKDNFVLVEMSFLAAPNTLFDIIFELQLAGYTPVLAHPERYRFYHHNFKMYEQLRKAGCLFQLNLLSTVGYYGKSIAAIADLLLDKKMIDFVGTDIHHEKHLKAFEQKVILKNIAELSHCITNNKTFDF